MAGNAGVMIGLGRALSNTGARIQDNKEFEQQKQRDALQAALAESLMKQREAQEARQASQDAFDRDKFTYSEGVKQPDWLNNPNVLDIAKKLGIPTPQPEGDPNQLLNDAKLQIDRQGMGMQFPESPEQLGIYGKTGIKIPMEDQLRHMRGDMTQSAFKQFDPSNPTSMQYNLLTGDNPPTQPNEFAGGFGEFIDPNDPKKTLTLPNIIGMQMKLQKFHPTQFLPVWDQNGLGQFDRSNASGGQMSPVATGAPVPGTPPNSVQVQPQAPAGLKAEAVKLAPLDDLAKEWDVHMPFYNYAEAGLLERGEQGLSNLYGSVSQTNMHAAQMDSLAKKYLATLSRLSGEVGVLTENDVTRAKEWTPSRWDSKDMASWKRTQFQQFLDDKKNGLMQQGIQFGPPPLINPTANKGGMSGQQQNRIMGIQWFPEEQ